MYGFEEFSETDKKIYIMRKILTLIIHTITLCLSIYRNNMEIKKVGFPNELILALLKKPLHVAINQF